MVTVLLGLALLPGTLLAAASAEPANPAQTKMHLQLNQLIREEHGIAPLAVAPVKDEPPAVAGGILQLEPMIIEEEKLKNLPAPETKVEKFSRTGTIWEKIGHKFTRRFWAKGDEGIMFTLSW